MASLLSIFILALVVQMFVLSKKQDNVRETLKYIEQQLTKIDVLEGEMDKALREISSKEDSLHALLRDIRDDLAGQGVSVAVDQNVLRIEESAIRFDLGRYEITADYAASATTIGRSLASHLAKTENLRLLDTVFVEGHTDSVPNSREMGNWGLSTYRAISLWKFWARQGGSLSEMGLLKNAPASGDSKRLFSVSGYADSRPVAGGSTADVNREEDRRIDLRFTVSAANSGTLDEVARKLADIRDANQALMDKVHEAAADGS